MRRRRRPHYKQCQVPPCWHLQLIRRQPKCVGCLSGGWAASPKAGRQAIEQLDHLQARLPSLDIPQCANCVPGTVFLSILADLLRPAAYVAHGAPSTALGPLDGASYHIQFPVERHLQPFWLPPRA